MDVKQEKEVTLFLLFAFFFLFLKNALSKKRQLLSTLGLKQETFFGVLILLFSLRCLLLLSFGNILILGNTC